MMNRYLLALLGSIMGLAAGAPAAQAALVITLRDSGLGVVGAFSGSLDVTGLNGNTTYSGGPFVGTIPDDGALFIETYHAAETLYSVSGPASFGTGGHYYGGSSTGDFIYLFGAFKDLYLPTSYVSGAPLSGTVAFAGESLSSLGLAPGSYVYTLGTGDNLTVQIGVPEPGTWALMLVGLGAVGGLTRRRRRLAYVQPALRR